MNWLYVVLSAVLLITVMGGMIHMAHWQRRRMSLVDQELEFEPAFMVSPTPPGADFPGTVSLVSLAQLTFPTAELFDRLPRWRHEAYARAPRDGLRPFAFVMVGKDPQGGMCYLVPKFLLKQAAARALDTHPDYKPGDWWYLCVPYDQRPRHRAA